MSLAGLPPGGLPPGRLGTTRIGPVTFAWGARTYVMGIVNVTPDSFSGDGLLRDASEVVPAAVAQARRMVEDGADLLDVGGESSRPGHEPVDEARELARVAPAVRGIRDALPGVPISVDTTKPAVAEAALDAGADCINDIWGVGPSVALPRVAARRGVPYVLMHNRAEARYEDVVAEVVADLAEAVERAVAAGVPRDAIVVDPGIGFGKTMTHNLALLRDLAALQVLGRPILLGTSRKSTIGHVLGGVAVGERLEGTLATTALGIAAGVDIVRVHDVRENVRVARMCDAILRTGEEVGA